MSANAPLDQSFEAFSGTESFNLNSDLLTANDVWDEEAVYPLHIQMNLPHDDFTLTDRKHLRSGSTPRLKNKQNLMSDNRKVQLEIKPLSE